MNSDYLFSAKDISIILTLFKYKEDFSSEKSITIVGSLEHFKKVLHDYIKNKCIFLGCIINYDFHWVLLFIMKKRYNFHIFFYDSFGRKFKNTFYTILPKYLGNFIFLYNEKQHQRDNNTCGVFVIMVLLSIFHLINKNTFSVNKIKYIVENINLTNKIDLIKHIFFYYINNNNEFNTQRN